MKNSFCLTLVIGCCLMMWACSPPADEPGGSDDTTQTMNVSVAEPEPTNTPKPQPTLVPTPTPVPLPNQVTAFTTEPLETTGPAYLLLRKNMAVMQTDDIPGYSEAISGRYVGNWQGQVSRLVESDGETKILIEMEPENERPRDDVVIHNVGSAVTGQLEAGQTVSFSGIITEIGVWEEARRMIHVTCEKIAQN